RVPGLVVLGHLPLEGVGVRHEVAHRVAAVHDLAAHLVLARVAPALAVRRAAAVTGVAGAVDPAVGVSLLFRVVAEEAHAVHGAHGSRTLRVAHDEETAGIPGADVRRAHLARRHHGIRLDLPLGVPGPDEVRQLLDLRP